jgi:hypothetical protein
LFVHLKKELLIKLRDFINNIDYDYYDRQLLLSIKEEVNENEDIKEQQKELNDYVRVPSTMNINSYRISKT